MREKGREKLLNQGGTTVKIILKKVCKKRTSPFVPVFNIPSAIIRKKMQAKTCTKY